MRKFFQDLRDSFMDSVEGGNLHQRRRLVGRMKAVVSDLHSLTGRLPDGTDPVRNVISAAQSMIDVAEDSIRTEESLRDFSVFLSQNRPLTHEQECARITAELDELLLKAAPSVRPKDLPN